jgi:hypothetical protein
MWKRVAVSVGLLLAAHAALASDDAKLVGTWKLVSWNLEFQSGAPPQPYLGQKWIGYTVFTPQGRTMSVWEAEGRKPPGTDEDRAALFRSMNAITGTYRYDAGTGVVDIDVAGNPASRGRQTRGYRLEGNVLEVTTPWAPSQTVAGAPVARSVIRFERVAR